MQTIEFIKECPVMESFRVQQVKSLFDLPISSSIRHEWSISLDIPSEWTIGLIVGPSGSGKTTIAQELFKSSIHKGFKWSRDRSIVDDFSKKIDTKTIISSLNSVGFSSPPSWLKPYSVLSNGEKFRAELARCIAEFCSTESGFFVFDEFSSVVDRTVAKVCSCAIQKAVRKTSGKMVAISCHFDIVEWLEPDWIIDMGKNSFTRRCLRRPKIEISFFRSSRELWSMFKQHHYLSGELSVKSQCFLAVFEGHPVSFAAVLNQFGMSGVSRVHRIVVLPDFQGIGIGKAFLRFLGDFYKKNKRRLRIISSHPAIICGLETDKFWKLVNFYKSGCSPVGKSGSKNMVKTIRSNSLMATFEFA